MERSALLQNLAQRIRDIERLEHPCRQTASPVGLPGLEEILPNGQLAAGALVEFLCAEEGAGVWTLALVMARQACGERKALVIADVEKRFYPPAASRLGIDLERTIVVRPKRRQQALAAMTQSLRCVAVGAAIGKLDRLSDADCRRLQCAAEMGGGLGFLLRPAAALGTPSFAAVRLMVSAISPQAKFPFSREPPASAASALAGGSRLNRVVRCRGGKSNKSLILEIDDETGDVHPSAGLASAAAGA